MGVPRADPDERAAALSQPWEAFRDNYPARSWDSYRKFRKRVQVAAFDDDQLAEVEAIARDTAAREAAAAFRERVDVRKGELIEQAISRDVARAVHEQARFEEFIGVLRSEMARVPTIDVPPLEVIRPSHTPETMVVMISDVHVGKLVREEFVGEGFHYDVATFRERLVTLERAILDPPAADIAALVAYLALSAPTAAATAAATKALIRVLARYQDVITTQRATIGVLADVIRFLLQR